MRTQTLGPPVRLRNGVEMRLFLNTTNTESGNHVTVHELYSHVFEIILSCTL